MHEFSLLADLLDKIEQVARAENAQRVLRVQLWLGALAHISPDHLREHFVAGARGTVADGAELEIESSNDVDDPNAQAILLQRVELV